MKVVTRIGVRSEFEAGDLVCNTKEEFIKWVDPGLDGLKVTIFREIEVEDWLTSKGKIYIPTSCAHYETKDLVRSSNKFQLAMVADSGRYSGWTEVWPCE